MGNANRWLVVLALIVMGFGLALRGQTTRPQFNIAGRVLAPDGMPVGGADVLLYATEYSEPPTIEPPLGKTSTDAQGQFTFQCESQNYTIVVQAASFGLSATIGSSAYSQPVEIRLRPATTVRITLIGKDAKPLPGVRVGLANIRELAVPTPIGAGKVPLELAERLARVTDDSGICTLSSMPREMSLSLRFFDDRYLSMRQFFPVTEPVQTTDAETVDAPPIRVERSPTIEGRVIRADTGQTVAGVSVTDRIVNFNTTGGRTMDNANAQTGSDGKFRLTQLIPGQHNISVELAPPLNAQLTAAAADPIDVKETDEIKGVELKLAPGAMIHGTATVSGTDKPIAGATITVGTSSSLGSTVTKTLTGADGTYAVCVRPGLYTLRISGIANQGLDLPRPNARQATAAENVDAKVDFACMPSAMPWVRGVVLDEEGHPVKSAQIIATPPGGGGGSSGSVDAIVAQMEESGGSTVSDADGKFELPFVTDRAKLHVSKDDMRMNEQITIDANHRDLSVVLRKASQGTLVVSVVDQTGQPIAGASVAVNWPSTWRITRTGPDGTLKIPSLFTDSTYDVYAGAWGYDNANASARGLTIQGGQETPVSLQLTRANSFIAGHVVNEKNEPLAGVTVRAAGRDAISATTRTKSDGSFRLDGLLAGSTVYVSTVLDGRMGQPIGSPFTHPTGVPVAAGTTDAVIVHSPTAPAPRGGFRRGGR